MALSPPVLSALIKANLLAGAPGNGLRSPPNTYEDACLQGWCDAVAAAVVVHLTGQGVVIGTATGVMAGGAAVPVLGTLT